ncbi:MAG: PQQ-binding-like beta-propeller repeat protein [Armatimonadetes bacterium]|nr:PQQ-binding-like beta-propeller repeat protein [Armatimonadota bacterium]
MTLTRIRLRGLSAFPLLLSAIALVGLGSPAIAGKLKPKGADAGLTAPFAVSWKFTGTQYPNNPSSPVILDNTLYYATGVRIYAMDAKSGALKWKYPTDATLTSPILTTPTVSGGVVYFGTGDGLYALDTSSGKQKWPHYNTRAGAVTSPTVINGVVYFGSGDQKVYSLDANTGEPLTSVWGVGKRAGREIGGDFAGNIASSGENFYFVTSDQVLRAVSSSSATLRWAKRLNASAASVTPTVSGENIYLSAGDILYCYRALSGQLRYSMNIGSESPSGPGVDEDGNAYIANSDRYLIAVSPRGRPLWKVPPQLEHDPISHPIVSGNTVIVGTVLGGVYAFDKTSGALLWHYVIQPSSTNNTTIPTSTNVSAPPIISGNTLYVPSDDGTLTAFQNAALDTQAPKVTVVEPTQGDYISGRTPFYIAAKVVDEGSGLVPNSISLQLDGQPIAKKPSARLFSDKPGFAFDTDTGELTYVILDNNTGQRTTLADGHHTLTILAKDWMGNTVNKSWSFYVDDSIRPRPRKKSTTTPGGGLAGGTGKGRGGAGGGGGGNGN